MRSHSTERLQARRAEVVAEIRRLQEEEHSILLVLDERGGVDVSRGMDGESARTVRAKVETARALGLRTVHIDDLTPDQAKQVGLPPRRAGPSR
jgi:hypothetical protein